MQRFRGIVVLLGAAVALEALAAPPSGPVLDGAALYLAHCASCHGRSGRGDGPDASLFLSPPRNLRDGFLDRYETSELVRRVRDGANLALPLDPAALRARAGETEALVTHLESIPDVNRPLATRGQTLYLDRCQPCHGFFGRPDATASARPARLPRDLSTPGFQRSLDDRELIRAVRHGRPGMPGIPALQGDAEARALVTFVRLLSPGFELYSRFCATCHGDDGRPQGEFAEPRRRPAVIFDRSYFARRDPEQLRVAVWHMLNEQKPSMPHFRGEVSGAGVQAIIEHLRGAD